MGRKGVLDADQWERGSVRDRGLTAPWTLRGTQQHGGVKNTLVHLNPPTTQYTQTQNESFPTIPQPGQKLCYD